MTEQKIIVADDWTRNWQANIAVKITAMVLWVVILVTFAVLVAVVWRREQDLRIEYAEQLQGLQSEINIYLSTEKNPGFEKLIRHVEQELISDPFYAIEISAGGETRLVGDVPKSAEPSVLTMQLPSEWARSGQSTVQLTAYHPHFRREAIEQSRNILLGVGLAILSFGVFLTWIIHTVLSKPFQVLINATQMVSEGNLDARINFTRQDEFGHLSKFFNEMLDRISNQQKELLTANQELKKENAVRMDAERALLLHRDHLEKLVEERTTDLAVARDQALQASQTKSAFIANMSHEVRTPLTAIIGFGESILEGNQSDAEKLEAVKTVIRNGRHLLTIINDILDMSKMEAGKLEIEKLAMSPFQLLADVESLVGMQAREKGLAFEVNYAFPLPKLINSDPTRLKQILLNLCSNAVKFTAQGSVRVTVSCNVAAQQMTFTVVDSGIGLSGAARERLFQPFTQADSSTTRKFGGTGLGLFISKRLAQMLGGDIQVESVEGIGSKFVVSVATGPLDKIQCIEQLETVTHAVPLLVNQGSMPSLHGKVLVAEDSIDNQRLISMYLRRAGDLDVTMVENGSLAVEKAMTNDYDLILMDMQMPVMGGLEAVKLLRAAGYGRPIVALTANAMKDDQKSYLAAGCDGFLSKPIDQQQFFSVLQEKLKAAADAGHHDDDAAQRTFESELKQLARGFVEGLPDNRAELTDTVNAGQWDLARSVAHKLKGMGGSFGYPEITRLAGSLEAALKKQDRVKIDEHYLQLLVEIDRVCAAEGIAV